MVPTLPSSFRLPIIIIFTFVSMPITYKTTTGSPITGMTIYVLDDSPHRHGSSFGPPVLLLSRRKAPEVQPGRLQHEEVLGHNQAQDLLLLVLPASADRNGFGKKLMFLLLMC